jgi:ATP synthase protein I
MPDFKWIRDYSDYFYMGLMFPSAIIVGTLIGYFIDKKFHTTPWGLLIGFIFGVIAGFVNLVRDYGKLTKTKDDDSTKN